MNKIYYWTCRTFCFTAILLLGNIIGVNQVTAQSGPTTPQPDYTPGTMGKILPSDKNADSALLNSTNPRDNTRYSYENDNSNNRLPESVTLRDLMLTPSNNDGIVIQWRTNWEPTNLKVYEIEYSTDGTNFQRVGTLTAQRYLNGKKYAFKHFPVNARDRIFYRIRSIDANGRYDYSPILAQAATRNTQNYVFPTIVNAGMVSLYLNDSFRSLQIVNMEGRVLQAENLSGKTGRIDVSLNNAARGICFVRVTGETRDRDIVQKIFIK